MMFLIIWTKPTKYFHSFFCGRLLYSHRLESSFQCCVFLNIFTVFFQSCGPNKLNLSSGQGWFQNIGSIQCTFCASGSDNRVDSSIKSRIPCCSLTSIMTFRIRSSNSPLYLLPATIPERSSTTTLLSFTVSGTIPVTIRCARPSTIAVFPTPGSPTRHGFILGPAA